MRNTLILILLLFSQSSIAQIGFRFAGGQSLKTEPKSRFHKSQILISPRLFYSRWGFDMGIGLDVGGLNVHGKVVSDKPMPADNFDLRGDSVNNVLFYTTPYVFINYNKEVYKSLGVYGGVSAGFMRAGNINSESTIFHPMPQYYIPYYSMTAGTDNKRTRSLGGYAGLFYKVSKNVAINMEVAARKVSLAAYTSAYYHPYTVYPSAVPREIRQTFTYYPITAGIRYVFSGSKQTKKTPEVKHTAGKEEDAGE